MKPATTYKLLPVLSAHSALPACIAYRVGPLAGEAEMLVSWLVPAMRVHDDMPSYSHTSLSY